MAANSAAPPADTARFLALTAEALAPSASFLACTALVSESEAEDCADSAPAWLVTSRTG